MALSAVQKAWLREEIGAQPGDEVLDELYDGGQTVKGIALSVLRQRRAKLLASPLSVNVPGVASVNSTENVKAIERRLLALSGVDDDPTSDPGEETDGGAGQALESFQLVRGRRR